jgi:DNA-binding transcriptional MocR family regulator
VDFIFPLSPVDHQSQYRHNWMVDRVTGGPDHPTGGAVNPLEAVLGRWVERPGPLHLKLTEALREAIGHGQLAGGTRLPSERELARRLAVSRSTVVTAYDALRAEGLLESRQGSGTKVRPVAHRPRAHPDGEIAGITVNPVYRSLLQTTGNVISLAAAALPADPSLAEAFAEFAAEDAEKLWAHIGYAPAGLPELRAAIALHLTAEGIPTSASQVLVTTGAQQAINLAATLLVQAGEEVAVESPSFAGTIDAFRSRGAKLVSTPLDADGVDVDALADLAGSRTLSAAYVMPSFHNPTGAQLSERRRRALAALATDADLPVIEDNTLEFAALDAATLPPVAAFADPEAPVISASSLNKAAWGGLRIGWMRGPEHLMSRLGELKALTDLGSPLIDQAIATRLVPRLGEIRERHRAMLRRNLTVLTSLLAEHLPSWSWPTPQGGVSLWVKLPEGDATTFAQVALRHGVEIIPGQLMSPGSDHQDCLRLPFTPEPTVLEETVRRLTAAWEAYASRDRPAAVRSLIV